MSATIDELRLALIPLMDGFPAPWCVAGGWAVDLFLGRTTRPHGDLELAVFREDQRLLHHHFRDWRFEKAIQGDRVSWPEEEYLELPVHEIHARRARGTLANMEFLLNERDGDDWVYRRHAAIRRPIEHAFLPSIAGLPILAPEIALLFKSKQPREKDEMDLASALPALDAQQRAWLVRAVEVAEPGHSWLRTIKEASGGDA